MLKLVSGVKRGKLQPKNVRSKVRCRTSVEKDGRAIVIVICNCLQEAVQQSRSGSVSVLQARRLLA